MKKLVKKYNELLVQSSKFFQEWCSPVGKEENYNEDIIEVDGLLVNCLPCHLQNISCYYKIPKP